MIKAFIIAALSADGFIAKDQAHPVHWSGKADHHRFTELTHRAGVVVMGSKTFENFGRPLAELTSIVYSRSKKYIGAESTSKGPRELLHELGERGFKEAAIVGGSEIFSLFMKAGVVDTVYLTVEPVMFGSGITLFKGPILEHLKLISSAESSSGAILLEYKVVREVPAR